MALVLAPLPPLSTLTKPLSPTGSTALLASAPAEKKLERSSVQVPLAVQRVQGSGLLVKLSELGLLGLSGLSRCIGT